MHTYEPKTFTLPILDGISAKSIEEHIGLYNGYVKNFNAISAAITDLMSDSTKNMHALSELTRRASFEFDGMRLHELYFSQLEKQVAVQNDSEFTTAITKQFGSTTSLVSQMKQVGLMRGPGWSILYYDNDAATFHIGFAGEQHQGHYASLPILLALDVWEHAFLLDHGAQGKGAYIDAIFTNLNWGVVENRFAGLRT